MQLQALKAWVEGQKLVGITVHVMLKSLLQGTNRNEIVGITDVLDEDTIFSGNRLIRFSDIIQGPGRLMVIRSFPNEPFTRQYRWIDGTLVDRNITYIEKPDRSLSQQNF